ncbi:hypothetical protein PG999_003669 [Apiospora kogelbergensis]|uniref:Uncharacterized protein n=1 Tax=Apiospora kogelbergensis TaxID=1337665 RepID=A0AAW0R4C9_9PEZI
MNEPQILEKRKAQTIKPIEELDPELRSVVHGPGRGRSSNCGSKTAPMAIPATPQLTQVLMALIHYFKQQREGYLGRRIVLIGDDSGSNFHFDLDQSPDAQSFPRGIDRDDTGSDTDDSDEHAETIEIDASGRPAHPTEGPALASYAHVETRFAPQVPQEIDILLNSTINSANACVNAAQAARAIFEARFSRIPNVSSLTGMPP